MVSGLPTLTSVFVTADPAPAGAGSARTLPSARANRTAAIIGRLGTDAFMTLPLVAAGIGGSAASDRPAPPPGVSSFPPPPNLCQEEAVQVSPFVDRLARRSVGK